MKLIKPSAEILEVFVSNVYPTDDFKITAVYSPENLFIVDLSDLSENIAIKITKEEKDYIRSEASAATSYLHDNNYSFLYE